ncbi:hypothetical protein FACS18942_01440 [Planctomycetales bacterium]|nr:hypothetical protein FACS18942_01440 [Planctomycetales bacterium]GHT30521.1 hypothetical protein FACS1894214_0520 [Planctomycetales bacterium]GHT33916.1 hypothetical protein FACS189427_00320 [Planctomycetales bacterium]
MKMNLKLIACELLLREFCFAAARSPHRIDIEFLPKGLHDAGRKKMSEKVAEAVAAADSLAAQQKDSSRNYYDAILLGYGLCSGGTTGFSTKNVPLVLPRAHDCITLFLGSSSRYQTVFSENPGTYFKTIGWIERGNGIIQGIPLALSEQCGITGTLESFIEKYGEKNAHYLWEQLNGLNHYSKIMFIETGIEPNDSFVKTAEKEAAEKGWTFEKTTGDLSLIQQFVNGEWNEKNFLIVPPGKKIEMSMGDDIVRCV